MKVEGLVGEHSHSELLSDRYAFTYLRDVEKLPEIEVEIKTERVIVMGYGSGTAVVFRWRKPGTRRWNRYTLTPRSQRGSGMFDEEMLLRGLEANAPLIVRGLVAGLDPPGFGMMY